MSRLPERPTITWDPSTPDTQPFVLAVEFQPIGSDHITTVGQFLSRSAMRALRNDMDAAEALDREHRMCPDDTHSFRRADAQPLLPPDAVAVQCRHCPATGVLENGTVQPVDDEEPCG